MDVKDAMVMRTLCADTLIEAVKAMNVMDVKDAMVMRTLCADTIIEYNAETLYAETLGNETLDNMMMQKRIT